MTTLPPKVGCGLVRDGSIVDLAQCEGHRVLVQETGADGQSVTHVEALHIFPER